MIQHRNEKRKSAGKTHDQWRAYSQTLSSGAAKQQLKMLELHQFGQPPLPPLPVGKQQLFEAGSLRVPRHKSYEGSQFPLVAASSVHADRALTLSRPLCRCRVMYLGSSVPHITKNGLHGIQEPLKHLYPEEQFAGKPASRPALASVNGQQVTTIDISHLSSSLGIDSWLSVWSNGLLLQNVDEFGQEIKRFFAIESLHYCAAVRYFDTSTLKQPSVKRPTSEPPVMQRDPNNNNNDNTEQHYEEPHKPAEASAARTRAVARFLPLDAPLFQVAGMMDANHPPVFAAIMRRTTGIKVLECHAFICRRDAAANALVRCCTHAYADLLNAKRLSVELATAAVHRQSWSPGPTGSANQRFRGASLGRNLLKKQQLLDSRPIEPPKVRRKSASSLSRCSSANEIEDDDEEGRQSRSSHEDNYAIITRHSRPADEQKGTLRTSRQRPSRGAAKGSSKSLFSDFQPKTSQPPAELGRTDDKLSHSDMELMSRLARSGAGDRDDDLQVDHSVMNSKRHSRSLQNLGQTGGLAEFCASSARSSSRLSRRRAREGPSSRRRARTGGSRERRSASLHDMSRAPVANSMAPAQAPVVDAIAPRPRPPAGRSRGSSAKRRNSRRRHCEPEAAYEVPRSLAAQPPAGLYSPLEQFYGPKLAYCGPFAQQAQHPALCLAPLAPHPPYLAYSPELAYSLAYQQQHQMAAMYAAVSAANTLSARGQHKARFRCLSPPANLVQLQQQQQQQVAESGPPPEAAVVSGQPALLAGNRAKRLSWIKRLSLTLSSGSGSAPVEREPDQTSPPSPSGQERRPKQRRASLLFGGSLTLGRARRPPQVDERTSGP